MYTLYRSQLLFMSAWSKSWSYFFVLLPTKKKLCITPCIQTLLHPIYLKWKSRQLASKLLDSYRESPKNVGVYSEISFGLFDHKKISGLSRTSQDSFQISGLSRTGGNHVMVDKMLQKKQFYIQWNIVIFKENYFIFVKTYLYLIKYICIHSKYICI